MNKKILRTLTAFCAALMLMGGFSVTAFAQTPEQPAADATNDSGVIYEEPEETAPLTPEGNATLVDDFGGNIEGAVIVNKVRESEPGTGFDAYNEKYVNMVEKGILDPAKVTRSALQNATSVASTLLTTESVVATIKEDAPAMPAGGAGGMGMM